MSTEEEKRVVVSGIQPTAATLHLGNYLGAVRPWVDMQADLDPSEDPSMFLFVADLHAFTTVRTRWQTPSAGGADGAAVDTAIGMLACGIDPERCVLFRQSAVPEHSQMMWLLSCVAPMGALSRMTQFKVKSERDGASLTSSNDQAEVVGLFSYPVLQAADILLYGATHVPVGEDQRQHLELTRDLADRFNRWFSASLVLPEATIPPNAGRVMSLADATRKMSKSDPANTRIEITDTPDVVRAKVRKAATDSVRGVTYEPETRRNVANLVSIIAGIERRDPHAVAAQYADAGTAHFKADVADCVISALAPIQQRLSVLQANRGDVLAILEAGAVQAQQVAAKTLAQAQAAISRV